MAPMKRKNRKQAPSQKKSAKRAPIKPSIRPEPPQAKPSSSKVTGVLARMRSGNISLRRASQEAKVSPRTVLKRAASALRKTKSGRYEARTGDRLVRQVKIPTPDGLLEIKVRGLREASKLARYWNFLDRYYQTGDKEIQKFTGQSVTDVDGVKHPLLTDLDVLNRAGSAGVYSFESIYGRTE